MSEILHDFPIKASTEQVFIGITTPQGLDAWWTVQSAGRAELGSEYELNFGPGFDWRARVTRCEPNRVFELELVKADSDWEGTQVGFCLEPRGEGTWIQFHHTGWPSANEHFRISSNCWAMYLRILRRYLEHGETVPYEDRLDV
jgi:uncharacterized protein YndB with AHSA1/START domain